MSKEHLPASTTNASLRHSNRDAAFYSIMSGSGETYFSAFAVFLKASTSQIAVLASLPPLLGSLAQLFSAWLGNRTGLRKPLILAGVYLQIFSWIPIITIPVLFPEHAVNLLIACVVIYYACAHFAVPQWSSMMGDLVPENNRGEYFGIRNRIASISSFLALILAGYLLHYMQIVHKELSGFVLIFCIAAMARLISAYHLNRMDDPPRAHGISGIISPLKDWRRLHQSHFARFSLFIATMQFSVAIASPFFTVYMLRDLNFSYLMFMGNTAASVLVQFVTLNAWGHISDRFGNRIILVITTTVITTLPALWLFSTNYVYLVLVQVLSGVVWAGFSLSAGNFVYDLVPSPKRATYVAYHNVLTNIGLFLGAILGGYLGMTLPTRFTLAGHEFSWGSILLGVFLLSSLCRMLTALLFIPMLREVRDVPPLSVSGLVFRVARFNALAGLVFDVLLPRSRKKGINEESKRH